MYWSSHGSEYLLYSTGIRKKHVFEYLVCTGVGVGMILTTLIGNIYYNIVIGWSLFYLVQSCQKELPWSHCRNDFNTDCKIAFVNSP